MTPVKPSGDVRIPTEVNSWVAGAGIPAYAVKPIQTWLGPIGAAGTYSYTRTVLGTVAVPSQLYSTSI